MPAPRDHEALLALLETRARRPFVWGRNDCARLAAAAVRVQTGRNLLAGLTWRSLRAAEALLAAEGGMAAAVSKRLTPVAPALAARGDIAGVPDERFGMRLMVVEGALLVGPGTHGLERLPRAAMTCAWSADAAPDASEPS